PFRSESCRRHRGNAARSDLNHPFRGRKQRLGIWPWDKGAGLFFSSGSASGKTSLFQPSTALKNCPTLASSILPTKLFRRDRRNCRVAPEYLLAALEDQQPNS